MKMFGGSAASVFRVCYIVLAWMLCTHCHHEVKRSLMFPSAVLQLSVGVSAPVLLPNRTINLSIALQANYDLPANWTLLKPYIVAARSPPDSYFDMDRPTFYKFITDYLDGYGINGEDCLLRSICEISEHPLYRQGPDTVLEKIVHYVFTPSEDAVNNHFYKRFIEAEKVGRAYGDCHEIFTECPISFVSYFTSKSSIFQ